MSESFLSKVADVQSPKLFYEKFILKLNLPRPYKGLLFCT